ncbi:hypothetical protein [Polaromonas sp.]|uniref:hypothetical protein n=1 Tax=Polaromonas sp. TaxID=1869339 RepID=UPI00352A34C3
MALDPSIILQAGMGVTPLLTPTELQDQRMQREVKGYQLNALRQSSEDDAAYRNVLRSGATPDEIPNKLYAAGLGAQAQAAQKFQGEQAKTARETEKAKLEAGLKHFEAIGQIMGGVSDQASYDTARQRAAQMFGPEMAQKIPPVYDPSTVARNQQQAMSVKEQLEQQYKRLTFGETQRHNMATEGNQAGSLEVARGNLGVSRNRLLMDQNAPKGQIVQTADGPMLADIRTGEARPVTVDGQQVRKPGKDIPPNVNKSIIENQQNISKIDRALAAITARPNSLGPQYAIPGAEMAGQYLDADGVDARAGVADIGSLILHDRSGAAVTASETPRLRPFIPAASDDAAPAKKKLQRFKEIYEEEAGLLSQTYGADQGYKESPALRSRERAPTSGVAPGAPQTQGKTVKRTGSLGGRKVVEYTDGSVEYAN